MSDMVKVILLGILEGVTEFIPVSSTGHLIVAASFLDLPATLSGTFEISIQLGAVLAVVVYYARSLIAQLMAVRHDARVRQWWLGIVVASVPAAIFGFVLGSLIQEWLFSPLVVALALIAGGILFLIVERRPQPPETPKKGIIADITLRQAIIVGTWQLLALIPGMSRSGMSIIGGMVSGLPRSVATDFSFYLAIPVLGGATVYTFIKDFNTLSPDDIELLLVGMLVSGIVAWFSIGWLLRYIARNSFAIFGYYRIIVGTLILILVATQQIAL